MAGQLGVGCQYCHIWEEWEREDRPQKAIARRMLAMTNEINKASFGGAPVVTCYTCHQGQPKPEGMVRVPAPAPPAHDAPPPPVPVLPSVDEVFGKYVQALGGESALRKISTRVITGKQNIATGPGGLIPMNADVEIYQKAPNLRLNVYKTEKFTISDGFDGKSAWARNQRGGVNNAPEPDGSRVRQQANLYEPLELKQYYTSLVVRGIERVGTRPAYVVVGARQGDAAERLYFDTESGLLLRRATYLQTAIGPSPFQIDFEDYREVDGVKIPFLLRMNPASQRVEIGTSSTLQVLTVRHGVAIEDGRFVRPTPPPRPQP
jgi:hypothetical protein